MKNFITALKHLFTLLFILVCCWEVSHVFTKWINKESFQGKVKITQVAAPGLFCPPVVVALMFLVAIAVTGSRYSTPRRSSPTQVIM